MNILSYSSKNKIIVVHDLEEADFIITNYMRKIDKNFNIDKNQYEKYYEIIIENKSINTVYKKI